jgi:hypothetical protein
MAMIRLRYETGGGNVSRSATYQQLIEHLRLASEAAYTLSHLDKAEGDDLRSREMQKVGLFLEKTAVLVTQLATQSFN